jgi:hypothetical protein
MSEAPSRPARGRSSARGGRASYGSRGPRKTNGDSASSNIDTSADQGELGELKKRYQSQLSTLKELFPDWTDADLVLAIEESDGDLQTTIEKISEGKRLHLQCMHTRGLWLTRYRRRLTILRSPKESKGQVPLQGQGERDPPRWRVQPAWPARRSPPWSRQRSRRPWRTGH